MRTTRRSFLSASAATLFLSAGLGGTRGAAAGALPYGETGVTLDPRPPADQGFFFPAEWHPHERTLMQFLPAQNWPRRDVEPARQEWAAVANTVAAFEPVTMAVQPEDKAVAKRLLSAEVELVEFPINDGWSRDSGPMVLVNEAGERCVAGFTFNGWGGKFPPYDDDALAKAHFAKLLDLPFHPADLVLEGGAVAFDGEGTLLTTEQCLLNPNRNPGKSKAEVEAILKAWLGVEKVIWLPEGLTPDPITDGHIDGMAAFAAPGLVLLHVTDDLGDPNAVITQTAKRILEGERDARGRKLEVVEIPLTSWDVLHMNFYLCNGAVIVPVAGRPEEDDLPLGILREVFPDHEVIGVTGRIIAKGGGGIHCITQQVPQPL